jgi:beta-lactamase class A
MESDSRHLRRSPVHPSPDLTKIRFVAAVALAGLVIVGCSGKRGSANPPGNPSDGPTTSGPSATVSSNPTSSVAPSRSATTLTTTASVASVFAGLNTYLAGRSGLVTAAVYDERTGTTWTLNPGAAPQDTASIVKVEIMGAALQRAQAKDAPLPATQASLMPPMIENSDNQSATTLLADVGGPSALAAFDRSAGMTDTTPSTLAFIPGTTLPGWGLTTTTALDEVRLMSKFAYPNDVLDGASRSYGLSLMENVEADQDWGVSGGVPAGTVIALKNGWLPLNSAANSDWQVNSIGWISGSGRDYVLAVLTTGSSTEAYGIATIDTIASSVFTKLG